MFKFAFAIGIVLEWVLGPALHSLHAFGYAALRAVVFMLLAWMVLEAVRMMVRAVDTLEDNP